MEQVERELKKFGIFHPKEGALNFECKLDKYEYEPITLVMAENLIRGFYEAQNDFNKLYALLGKRSTCVGDIITDEEHAYMVFGSGCRRISTRLPIHKIIMDMDKVLRKPLTDADIDNLMDNAY